MCGDSRAGPVGAVRGHEHNGRMRHSEFWERLDLALGPDYARSWADMFTITALGSRTASEALAAGVPPKQVWAAVGDVLGLPAAQR